MASKWRENLRGRRGQISSGMVKGTWYLRYELPPGQDGKRRQRRETFTGTKRQAEDYLEARRREVATGTIALECLTFKDVAIRWLASREHTVAAKTFHRYQQITEQYIVPELGVLQAEKLRPIHIENCLTSWRKAVALKDSRKLSDRSIRHNFDTLRSICRWATKMGLMAKSPCEAITPPRWDQKEMSVLDADSLMHLIDAAKGSELEIPIIVLVGTGLRRGELFGLRWNDIDFERARLTVRRSIEVIGGVCREKPPKTARSSRTLALAPFVVDILRRQHREQAERRLALGLGRDIGGYVFDRADCEPWNPELFGWRFADLVKRKNLSKIRLHDLRHSYATFMLLAGADLKSISTSLGHSTIAITANTYAHATDSLLREHADKLQDSIGGFVDEALASKIKK